MQGTIFDIKEFTVHDGPGIRSTIFLKGCPLRCIWCHNPEGLSSAPQLMITQNGCTGCGLCRKPCDHPRCQGLGRCAFRCPQGLVKIAGERVEAKDLADRMLRQREFFESSGGGVTISGGEPLFQPAFLMELLERLAPLHRLIETSGYAPEEVFRQAAERCEHVFLDIKHPDDAVHRRVTGVSNKQILKNLSYLKQSGLPYTIRIPLIPGINDDPAVIRQIAGLLKGERGALQRVEFMPYNPFAPAKYEMTGMPFTYKKPRDNELSSLPLEEFHALGIQTKVL